MFKVEVSRPGDVIDVGLKRESAIEDHTQTLNLLGGGNGAIVNVERETLGFG